MTPMKPLPVFCYRSAITLVRGPVGSPSRVQMPFIRAAILGAVVSTAFLLAGCGVKPSQLAPPEESKREDVRDPYVKKAPPKDGQEPDKPFILDGLLM